MAIDARMRQRVGELNDETDDNKPDGEATGLIFTRLLAA